MILPNKTQIVKDACRRYPQIGSRTIAQFIVAHHPGVFNSRKKNATEEDAVSVVRNKVRYYRGKMGTWNKMVVTGSGSLIPSEVSKMPASWNRYTKPYKILPGLWLWLGDVHTPKHNERALEAAIKAGQIEGVDGIILAGDFQDCAAVGFWTQERRAFMEELDQTIDMLDFIRGEFEGKKIIYKIGNHEDRLKSYYRNNADVLSTSPLASMDLLFAFEHRGIEIVEPQQKMMFGMLPAFHGHEFKLLTRAVNPARGLFLKTHSFAICAHCHTTSMHTTTDVNDVMLTTWSVGCLCDLHPDWYPYGNQWNHGFALINVERNGDFEVVNRRILPSGQVV